MNHALAVSALIGSILDNNHVACLKSYNLALAGSVCQYVSIFLSCMSAMRSTLKIHDAHMCL